MSEAKRSKAVKPLPYRIEYNTDLYFAPDAEDLKRQYIISIKAADESTVIYTDDGYFEIEKDQAEFIVEACNNYERVCTERDELAKALREAVESNVADIEEGKRGYSIGSPRHQMWKRARELLATIGAKK